jgi:thiol-disulfide isomerase/thioredoxin
MTTTKKNIKVKKNKGDISITIENNLNANNKQINHQPIKRRRRKKKVENTGPKKVTSAFGKLVPGIDNGKKLLCFFAPGCDHCQAAAKTITQLSKTIPDFPQVHVVFMEEETEKIPEFFKIAGKTFPYQILGIAKFVTTMGTSKDTPGVVLMWNGNIIKFFDGINANQFDAAKLKAELAKMK